MVIVNLLGLIYHRRICEKILHFIQDDRMFRYDNKEFIMIFFRKLIFIIFFASFSCMASATNILTCPTAAEIKNGQFNYWLPLYKEGEELASDHDVNIFKQHITSFDVARWDHVYLENGHCFYKGTDPMLDKVIFAHMAWRPVVNDEWHWVSPAKSAECYSSDVKNCGFIE